MGPAAHAKCKLVEGRVIHGAHQAKALSAEEEAAGYLLTCCATPQTDLVIEARQVVGLGDFAVQKMPTRVTTLERVAPDVIVLEAATACHPQLRLPRRPVHRVHLERRQPPQLLDGQCPTR